MAEVLHSKLSKVKLFSNGNVNAVFGRVNDTGKCPFQTFVYCDFGHLSIGRTEQK